MESILVDHVEIRLDGLIPMQSIEVIIQVSRQVKICIEGMEIIIESEDLLLLILMDIKNGI